MVVAPALRLPTPETKMPAFAGILFVGLLLKAAGGVSSRPPQGLKERPYFFLAAFFLAFFLAFAMTHLLLRG
jgi:hypothetical protein